MPGPIVKCFHDKETGTCQYIVSCADSKTAAIIDPVLDFNLQAALVSYENANKLLEYCSAEGLNVTHILETHAHADHISASQYLKARLALKGRTRPIVCIGELITTVQQTFAPIFNTRTDDGREFDHLFKDNEEFQIGSFKAKVLHVPGHTPDHLCYVIGNCVFTGDSIFVPDSGSARCDFPGGSAHTLFKSIREVLFSLPDDYLIYVGHDYPTEQRPLQYQSTVADQKANNKHVKLSVTEAEFIKMRQDRDKTLGNPKLLFPSLQCNIKAGHCPDEKNLNDQVLFKLPVKINK